MARPILHASMPPCEPVVGSHELHMESVARLPNVPNHSNMEAERWRGSWSSLHRSLCLCPDGRNMSSSFHLASSFHSLEDAAGFTCGRMDSHHPPKQLGHQDAQVWQSSSSGSDLDLEVAELYSLTFTCWAATLRPQSMIALGKRTLHRKLGSSGSLRVGPNPICVLGPNPICVLVKRGVQGRDTQRDDHVRTQGGRAICKPWKDSGGASPVTPGCQASALGHGTVSD